MMNNIGFPQRSSEGPPMNNISDNRYAVVPSRIWDGTADGALGAHAVLVKGSRIEAVASIQDLPAGIRRIDLPGCTLLPGLIDSHAHYAKSFAPAFLSAGVTTIRDVGNNSEWILAQRQNNLHEMAHGPRILCCGWALDGMEGIWKYVAKRHPDEESLRASIRENIAQGVDAIKLYASLSAPLLRAGVEEAHSHGRFVLAHLNNTSAVEAAEAGLNEIEHFSRCDVAWRPASQADDDTLIDLFLAKGTIMNPTLNVWDRLGRALEHVFLHDIRRKWVHPELLEIWDRIPYRRCEANKRMRFQSLMPNLKRFLLRCHERDVVIAAGTDLPFINLIPGFALHDELAQYVDAGMRPVDALRAATSTNAKVLGLADRIGRIAPSLDADLVAVGGNPLERIDDLANVKLVVRGGVELGLEGLFDAAQQAFKAPMDDPIIRDLRDYVAGEMPSYAQKG